MNKNDFRPAGFGMRLAAMLIDNLILGIALAPIFMLLFGQNTMTEAEMQHILQTQGPAGLFDPNQLMIQQAIVLLVTAFFWVKFAGTPGKRLLGLRVIDAKTGKNLAPMQATLRYLGYFLSALPMCLGFFWVLVDEKNQAWHDKIAGTLVVEDKPKRKYADDNHPQTPPRPSGKDDDDTFTA